MTILGKWILKAKYEDARNIYIYIYTYWVYYNSNKKKNNNNKNINANWDHIPLT